MAENKKAPKTSSKPEKKSAVDAEPTGAKKFFARIKQFFKDVKSETKKIVWNPWPDTIKSTGVVLMVTVVVGSGVWISDALFRELMKLVYKLAEDGGETAMIMIQSLTDLL